MKKSRAKRTAEDAKGKRRRCLASSTTSAKSSDRELRLTENDLRQLAQLAGDLATHRIIRMRARALLAAGDLDPSPSRVRAIAKQLGLTAHFVRRTVNIYRQWGLPGFSTPGLRYRAIDE